MEINLHFTMEIINLQIALAIIKLANTMDYQKLMPKIMCVYMTFPSIN